MIRIVLGSVARSKRNTVATKSPLKLQPSIRPLEPIPMHEDNESALKIATNQVKTRRIKHLYIRNHHIQHAHNSKQITTRHIATALNKSNILTKALKKIINRSQLQLNRIISRPSSITRVCERPLNKNNDRGCTGQVKTKYANPKWHHAIQTTHY